MNPQNPNDDEDWVYPANQENIPNPNLPPPPPESGVQVINHSMYLRGKSPKQPKFTGREKLILVGIIVGLLLLGGLVFYIWSLLQKDSGPADIKQGIAYDSPMGLMPGFQNGNIKGGKFKQTAAYVTEVEFQREGSVYVDSGKVSLEMVTDTAKVNELLMALYSKNAKLSVDEVYNEQDQGTTRNFAYDFNSLLGYYILYDKNAEGYGGFIPMIEKAKEDPKSVEGVTLYKLGPDCDAALRDVRAKTGENLTTQSLNFDIGKDGTRTKATVSHFSRQTVDEAVVRFLDSCFDFSQPTSAEYKKYADNIREHTTLSPDFTYWQDGDKHHLTISDPGERSPFGGEIRFEFTELSSQSKERTGSVAPYIERRNLYGLAYSLCRVVPVVAQDTTLTYRFLKEDTAYMQPGMKDSGYFCTTLSTPNQYKPATPLTVKYDGNVSATFTGVPIDNQRAIHDLLQKVEKYNLDNKRYPAQAEFTALANNNMGPLTTTIQKLLADKAVVYTPQPANCINDCNDFVLTQTPQANVEIKHTSYKPQ